MKSPASSQLKTAPTPSTVVAQPLDQSTVASLINISVHEALQGMNRQPNIIIQIGGQSSSNYKPKNKRKNKPPNARLDTPVRDPSQDTAPYVVWTGNDLYWMSMVKENQSF